MIRVSISIELVGTDQDDLSLMRRLIEDARKKEREFPELAVYNGAAVSLMLNAKMVSYSFPEVDGRVGSVKQNIKIEGVLREPNPERHMKEVKIPAARELAGPGFPTLLPDVDPDA